MEKESVRENCPEVTFKYYLPENNEELWIHVNAAAMYGVLWEIHNLCRTQIKHGDDEKVSNFAEKIQEEVWKVDLNRVH